MIFLLVEELLRFNQKTRISSCVNKQSKHQKSVSAPVRGFSIILILKGMMTFYSQVVHVFWWKKFKLKIKLKWNRKWKISYTVLLRQTLYFNLYRNCKLKVKLWWVGTRERKKGTFFVPFILSKTSFFNIYVLSQCKVYWIHFQNTHTLTYEKTLLYTIFPCFWNRWKPSLYP